MWPYVCPAFCCGLFAVAVQTLLLRECLTVFVGGDIWLGALLGMWFLGGVAGAFIYRRTRDGLSRLGPAAEMLLLVYIPVSCLQYFAVVLLIMVGVDPCSVQPLQDVFAWSLLIAAPGGLLTGLFLPMLCRRTGERVHSPISAVCMSGAAGGVLGGLIAAFLPQMGMGTIPILVVLAVSLCGTVAWWAWSHPQRNSWRIRMAAAVCLVVVLVAAILRVDVPLTRGVQEKRWSRLVPTGTLDGSFRTRRAAYLHGADGDCWVVIGAGGTSEVVGDRTEAGRIAAIALCQNFTAERVLVIGDGLSICERFLLSSNVKGVDWFHPDRDYIQALLAHLPERFRISDPRLRYSTDDIRTTLAARPQTYDVVVINLPTVVDASLHHLVSTEFLEMVRPSLRSLGVVVLGIAGDRNVPGVEPAYQGAWAQSTLDAVFSQSLLVPVGERTFFVSAAAPCLVVSPISLETRFSLIENANKILPVELLSSVYHPDRSLQMLPAYDAVEFPEATLVNHDARPSHALCSLMQATDRSGLSLVKPVQSLLRGGLTILVVPILLLAVARLLYVIRTAPRIKGKLDPQCTSALRSDVLLVCGCAATVSVVVLILLVHAWLMVSGSLPLCIGLAFSLFLGGLAVGALCARWAVSRLHPKGPGHLHSVLLALGALLVIDVVCLAVSGLVVNHPAPWPVLAVLLSVYGFLAGVALILGVKVLEGCGVEPDSAAACLAGANHLGAAAGAVVGLFLIPLTGFHAVLYVAAALALGSVVLAGAAHHDLMRPGNRVVPHPWLTPVGYGLFAAALAIIICSHILAYKERTQVKSQAMVAIQDWVQGRRLSARTAASAVASKEATYHEVRENSQLKGYIFRSEDFSNMVYGYGGPMSVILFADPAGTLIDFRITRSRETPRYISRIRDWMASLKGKKVFGPAPMDGVNAVSGATLSCNAILRLLRNSGQQFDASVLSGVQTADAPQQDWFRRVDWLVVYWAGGIVLALAAIRHGKLWSRLAVLAFTAAVGGFWLNRQYSTDHVLRLLSGQGLLDSPIAIACLLLGGPLIVLFLGNIYCGYLCPFGAVQELLSFVLPKRLKARLSLSTITVARSIKYGVLFVLVAVFFLADSKRFLEMDPLTLFFSRQFWLEGFGASPGLVTALVVLFGALVVTRMWCRYLCPTGAFLSLFNVAGWLGRFLPAKKFGRCEFGLGGRDHMDCIHCDRCRYESRLLPARDHVVAKAAPNVISWALLAVVFCLAAWTLMPVFRKSPAATASQPASLTENTRNRAQNPFPVHLRPE